MARFLFALISATCIGLGLVAVITGYVPPRSTRFGMTNAAVGDAATVIGVITILFGMMPLGVFAKTARRAAIWASGWAVAGLALLAAHLSW